MQAVDPPTLGAINTVQTSPVSNPTAFLHGLRGLAALYVVVFHATEIILPMISTWPRRLLTPLLFGNYAVDVFLVLSGFLLTVPAVKNGGTLPGGTGNFLLRRAWRLYPPFLAATVLIYCVCLMNQKLFLMLGPDAVSINRNILDQTFGWSGWLARILMVHNFHPVWTMGPTGHLWTIPAEWHCYLIYALVGIPVVRRFGWWPMVVGLLGLLGISLWLQPRIPYEVPWMPLIFLLGSAAAAVCHAPGSFWVGIRKRFPFGSVGAVLIVILILIQSQWPTYRSLTKSWQWPLDFLLSLAVALWIVRWRLSASDIGRTGTWIGGRLVTGTRWILETRPLQWAGDFSYSLYLVHSIPQYLLSFLLPRWIDPWEGPTFTLVYVPIMVTSSLLLAWGFYRAVEHPLMARRKQILGR